MLSAWYAAYYYRVDPKHFPQSPELIWRKGSQDLAVAADVIVAQAKARAEAQEREAFIKKHKPQRQKKKKKN